jgi:hypothetical protein
MLALALTDSTLMRGSRDSGVRLTMRPPSGVNGVRLVRFNRLSDDRDMLVYRLRAFRDGSVNGPRFEVLKALVQDVTAWAERAREFFRVDVPKVDLEDESNLKTLQALRECVESAR